jgi:S-adenosylmethionine:tRNA ribosyltransferase-isomerase
MDTALLDYLIPKELIAQHPPAERGTSRLLDYSMQPGSIADRSFKDIASILDDRYFLILNDTPVIPARILAKKPTGAQRELLFLSKTGPNEFKALVRGKTRAGDTFLVGENIIKAVSPMEEGWLLHSALPADELIARYGRVALPPYIKRIADAADKTRYQTVYADDASGGSSAAPTAGLHFTDKILRDLTEKGIYSARITLQIGIGTFRPIKTETVEEHIMHSERYFISEENAEKINAFMNVGKIPLCVGTTAVRAVESAAVKSKNAYRVKAGSAATDLFILPGYKFNIAQALITNFHLPRSTLLLLVSALTGIDRLRNIYSHAIEKRYRFFSYGDAMIIR